MNDNKEMEKDDLFSKAEGKLYNYNKIKVEIECLDIDIDYLKKDIQGCKAIIYENERTGNTNNTSNPIEAEVLKKEKEIQQKTKERNHKEKIVKKIDKAMTILDEQEMNVLKYRYFSNRRKAPKWEYIANMTGYSEKNCRVIKDELVNKIKNMI